MNIRLYRLGECGLSYLDAMDMIQLAQNHGEISDIVRMHMQSQNIVYVLHNGDRVAMMTNICNSPLIKNLIDSNQITIISIKLEQSPKSNAYGNAMDVLMHKIDQLGEQVSQSNFMLQAQQRELASLHLSIAHHLDSIATQLNNLFVKVDKRDKSCANDVKMIIDQYESLISQIHNNQVQSRSTMESLASQIIHRMMN